MATVKLTEPLRTEDGPPARTYSFTAPNAETTPRVARDMVVALLRATEHPGIVEDARLLVSEVVTNVVQHTAACLLTVEAVVSAESVRVSVSDGDCGNRPSASRALPDTAAEHGRGLLLVSALASQWGVSVGGELEPMGKSVWFVLTDCGAAACPDCRPAYSPVP
jgi:anti-sigma regulatory factor (Ser/Thr protein kinase)